MSKRPKRQPCSDGLDLAEILEPRFFKALGDPNRITLLCRLAGCGRACTVSEISCCCPVDLSVVSRHLAILRDAGIVESQRQGKEVHYRLSCDVLADTFRRISETLDQCCPPSTTRAQRSTQEKKQ